MKPTSRDDVTPQAVRYDESYFRSYNYEGASLGRFSMYWWARRYYATLVKRRRHSGRLLEIGCGLGHLLARLENRFETFGIDISEYAVAQARRVARRSTVEVLPAEGIDRFGPDAFDVIVALHLMEHLHDPALVLRKCAQVSRRGGLLLMTTPNLRAPFIRLKGEEWQGYKDKTHINMKEPHVWRQLLEASGFRVEKVFGDGLWNVPYVTFIPARIQLAFFGLPAAVQTLTGTTFNPARLGENLIILAEKSG